MSENNNISPWIKLAALSIVGGVAKSLFAPTVRYIPREVSTTAQRVGTAVGEKVADSIISKD